LSFELQYRGGYIPTSIIMLERGENTVINVLYLLNHAGKAGTERYVETLVKYLNGERINAFFAYHEPGLLVETMEALGVPIRQLELRSRFDLKAAKALAKLCKEWNIDLIHCHYLREHYLALLAKGFQKDLRVVYTNHFVMENDGLTRFTNRLLDKRQDRMIAVCNKGKTQLVENGWGGMRIDVIFNAVDPAAWAGDLSESSLRKELSLSEEHFVMLCASRFAHDKGHKYLVNSISRLTELTQIPFTLVLAGDGPLLEETKTQVHELGLEGKIKFIGFRKDIKNLYKGSDLYVNASQHEALSFLIIEAMAAGLPVVATDMYGNSDIVNSKTNCGLLVEYDNADSMAVALKCMMEDPAFLANCRQNALKAVDEFFEIHKMADATYQVYEKAMSRAK
jgi:glycosyltransferase involved in cell wall biosynthesis